MIPTSLVFPAVVVALGVGLLLWGLRSGGPSGADEREAAFHHRQWRRRAATGLLTITLGVGLYAIQLVPPRAHPTAAAALWMLLLFGVLALFGMAAADALASTGHLARLRNRQQAARLALEAELRRARSRLQGDPSQANTQTHGPQSAQTNGSRTPKPPLPP